jgi:carboxymethylenebutenolidase
MTDYLVLPSSGKGPGILVLHAWWGLNDTFKGVCDRLAEAGFVALAPDYFHGQLAQTQAEARQLKRQFKAAETRKMLSTALKTLLSHPALDRPQVGLVGFSLGAYYALGMADSSRDVAAAVTFYGGGGGAFQKSRASFLGHFAEDDPFESPEGVADLEARLRAAERPVEFYFYAGTKHWFFETDRPEYDRAAAELAWERTLHFLRANL